MACRTQNSDYGNDSLVQDAGTWKPRLLAYGCDSRKWNVTESEDTDSTLPLSLQSCSDSWWDCSSVDTANPFGRIERAWLKLEGSIQTATLGNDNDYYERMFIPDDSLRRVVYHTRDGIPRVFRPEPWFCSDLDLKVLFLSRGDIPVSVSVILIQEVEHNRYRRVGWLQGFFNDTQQGWERRTVILIQAPYDATGASFHHQPISLQQMN